MSSSLTYADAGVNIDNADNTKAGFSAFLDNKSSLVINKVGAFASLVDISSLTYKHPVLVLKTEEPGSKQLLAIQHGSVRSICFDMINHLTNDVIVMGARPLAVQDAIICGKLEKPVVTELVKGIADACLENETVLTGGETSEQPNVIDSGRYILTSSMVGIVERDRIIDGSTMAEGYTVLALPSNGLHTNGYSLVRAMMKSDPALAATKIEGETFMEHLLKVHTPYYKALKPLFAGDKLAGMAHITGGGIPGNLNRIIPAGLSAQIDLSRIRLLPLFRFIREKTGLSDAEMLKTFNLGVGLVAVAKAEYESNITAHLASMGVAAYPIGTIIKAQAKITLVNSLAWRK